MSENAMTELDGQEPVQGTEPHPACATQARSTTCAAAPDAAELARRRQRMRERAFACHLVRKQATERRVLEAVITLRVAGLRVTTVKVAEMSGVCREHITRRYRHLLGKP